VSKFFAQKLRLISTNCDGVFSKDESLREGKSDKEDVENLVVGMENNILTIDSARRSFHIEFIIPTSIRFPPNSGDYRI